MALAAAEKQHGELDEATSEKVKAYSAATDNVGLFFGEDIFFAIGSIILIQQTLATYGIVLAPLELAVWAIPTAIAAFLIHGTRLLMLDRTPGAAPGRRPSGPRFCGAGSLRPRPLAGRTGRRHDHPPMGSTPSPARCSPPSRCSARSTAPTPSASATPPSGG